MSNKHAYFCCIPTLPDIRALVRWATGKRLTNRGHARVLDVPGRARVVKRMDSKTNVISRAGSCPAVDAIC